MKWELGEDLFFEDNLLDGITFEEVVTTVMCNSKHITREAVRLAVKQIIEIRLQDMDYLLDKNVLNIVKEARKRRAGGTEG